MDVTIWKVWDSSTKTILYANNLITDETAKVYLNGTIDIYHDLEQMRISNLYNFIHDLLNLRVLAKRHFGNDWPAGE